MALEGKSTITGRRDALYIYIPKEVVSDSTFPFKLKDQVNIKIQVKKLVIE